MLTVFNSVFALEYKQDTVDTVAYDLILEL